MAPDPTNPAIVVPFHTKDMTPQEKSAILEAPKEELDFTLFYINMASVGATARDLLSYGQANWEDSHPDREAWYNRTIPTPFGCMPVLHITSRSTGQKVYLSEAFIVDTYLAEKFHLLGNTRWESLIIQSYYSNITALRERGGVKIMMALPENRATLLHTLLTIILPRFIAQHQVHLAANGANGHYVGDELSLADIHLANTILFFSTVPFADQVMAQFRASELLWKVKEKVEANKELAAWRATKKWKEFERAAMVTYHPMAVPGAEDQTPHAKLLALEAAAGSQSEE